ncbi:FtsW/RodA/SpoVE family cell cycle protein [Candidatus Woesebacteria bacterium]|nr:FtsW/RodA/SpoVE family cell cycle protein [Candidatus Woesebacteria bacterium]
MRPRSSIFPLALILFAVISVITLRSIDPTYGTNQLVFFLVSFVAYGVVSSLPFLWLKKLRWLVYFGVVGLLLITLVVGTATNGSVSWIRFGSYRLQPSEFLKPALLFLAGIEIAVNPLVSVKNMLRFLVLAGLPLGLVMLQPDLGTTLVTGAGLAAIYFFSAPRRQFTLSLTALGIVGILVSWLFLLQPYQKDRIRTFLNPQSDPLGSGYNARQAMIAVGSGEIWGKGFGNGLQTNLQFLPERHTDFLFATFGEETGFIGSSLLISFVCGHLFLDCAYPDAT